MPTLRHRIPKLCRHKSSGQAYAKFNGSPVWFGRWGEHETREAYDRFVAEWLHQGREVPKRQTSESDEPATVTAIIVAYWKHAERRYAANHANTIKSMLQIVRSLYGSTEADAFGPKRLRVVRSKMIERGWRRRSINAQVSRLRSVFKWAAAHELCSERVYRKLSTVEPLRKGEAKKESTPIKPVPRSHVRRVRRHLTRPVRALIDLQLLTGARGCELVGLRAMDFDRSSKHVWTVQLEDHKTSYRDKPRTLYFGPRARRILALFMTTDRPLNAPLFSPCEANSEAKRRNANGQRRAKQKPTPKKTDRSIGEAYSTDAYRRAIHRACEVAFPPPGDATNEQRKAWRDKHRWSPHRLRHNAATFLRRQYGIDMASIILGHSSLVVTQTYAEANEKRAREVMRQSG